MNKKLFLTFALIFVLFPLFSLDFESVEKTIEDFMTDKNATCVKIQTSYNSGDKHIFYYTKTDLQKIGLYNNFNYYGEQESILMIDEFKFGSTYRNIKEISYNPSTGMLLIDCSFWHFIGNVGREKKFSGVF